MTTERKRIPINGRLPYEPADRAGVAAEVAAAAEAGTRRGVDAAGPVSGAGGDAPVTDAADQTFAPAGEKDLAGLGGNGEAIDRERLQTECDQLKSERDTLADQVLRLRAEFENYRRRASRDLVEARQRSQGELLADMLSVLDNLERALDAAEHHDEGKVLGGVRLTKDLFLGLLKRAGVEEIATDGVPFDPELHEAVLFQPSELPEGAITAVLAKGYRQDERVLRPARVAVSAGPAGGSEG